MKRIISIFLVLVVCFSLSATVFAEYTGPFDSRTTIEESGRAEQTRAEETEWYYRVVDNYYVQQRLWSITYGRWLTEWETIGHL